MKTVRVVTVLCCLLLAGKTFGQKPIQGLRLDIHTGGVFPANQSLKQGFLSGFGFSYPFYKNLSFHFNFSLWKSPVERQAGSLWDGDVTVTFFLLSARYAFFEGKKVIPYMLGGGGIVFTDFNMGDIITIPELTIRQKVESGLCVYMGGGLQIRIWRNLALFSEAFYLYRKAEGKTVFMDMNLGTSEEPLSVNLSSFCLQVGLRYSLK
ncbi:MAG: hypothetical protein JXB26_15190 [Candidatus Aminicenantes bacterium]|nr:hypothetical protein [Candidatus Aminicenantes bacterium]